MTNRKLTETITVLAIAVLALTVFAPGISAQAKYARMEIPFDFYVGSALMPAGPYSIAHDSNLRAVQIVGRNGHAVTFLPLQSQGRATDKNRLVFNRYGALNFLSEMQLADSSASLKVRASKLELEARLAKRPTQVTVHPSN